MILRLFFRFESSCCKRQIHGQVSLADILAKTICGLIVDNWNFPKLKMQFNNETFLLTILELKQPCALSARLPANSLQRNISENLFLFICREDFSPLIVFSLKPGIERINK